MLTSVYYHPKYYKNHNSHIFKYFNSIIKALVAVKNDSMSPRAQSRDHYNLHYFYEKDLDCARSDYRNTILHQYIMLM